ncbi:Flp pilus assembly protein TadD [Gramella sp. Hel_I_59]|uniref:tetratricopeptide repeat protein n=1 Tax=Gramella sp. Hel_I_59 TaxID=1249978 RepID=UPI00115465F7|nr:tetratricopeptide repeat protein [Gramella sp. Hel_I_59]TQI71249.1 Flp pilus assembly protein TadD [Gramella sp. Hel_I_59]
MKYKLLIIIFPLFLGCEFSNNKNSFSGENYQKSGNDIISFKKDNEFGFKEGSKVQKLNSKGVDLGIKKKYQEAEKVLKKALLEEPKNPIILNNIGLTYYNRGIYNTAIKYFNQSLMFSDSTSIMAATNLGLTYYDQMDYARALEIMNFSLSKQNGDNVEKLTVRLNRIMVNIELEDCDEIFADRKAIEYLRHNNELGDYAAYLEEVDEQLFKLCTTTVHRQ